MKNVKGYITGSLFLVTALLLSACSQHQEDGIYFNSGDKVEVRGSIPAMTRIDGTNWEPNDEIGIFMLDSEKKMKPFAENINYCNSATSVKTVATFEPNEGVEPLYFPQDKTTDFVAYYPYVKDLNEHSLEFDLTTYPLPDQYKYLIARAEGVTPGQNPVQMEFRNFITKITLFVSPGEGLSASEVTESNLTGIVSGVILNGSYDLVNDKYHYSLSALTAEDLHFVEKSGNVLKYEAYVLPLPESSIDLTTVILTMTTPNKSFSFKVKSEKTTAFESGKEYIYNATLNIKGITVNNTNIIDWYTQPKGSHEGIYDKRGIEYVNIGMVNFYMGKKGNLFDRIQHQVFLSNYYMSKYEITVKQYLEFLNDVGVGAPSSGVAHMYIDELAQTYPIVKENGKNYGIHYDYTAHKWVENSSGALNKPITSVSWYGAFAFADWADADLPTEAEWEGALRGSGNSDTQTYFTGDDITTADANYQNSGIGAPTNVGETYPPTKLGLYNMAGNVSEWCYDYYDIKYGLPEAYFSTTVYDPMGPSEPNSYSAYVMRGGDFGLEKFSTESAFREGVRSEIMSIYLGFRVVRRL